MIRVIARRRDWSAFIKRAKKSFPKEHCEALWGEATVDGFRVAKFSHMSLTSDKGSVEYGDAELHKQMRDAAASGTSFIGTVHTHPSKSHDTCASSTDHHVAAKDGERIMGVVLMYKNASNKFVVESDWWVPQPRIGFELVP